MGKREIHFSVRPYLWHAVAATLVVIVVPTVLVLTITALTQPDPPMLLIASLGVAFSIAASAIGSALWSRRIESVEIGFSDLMLWRWLVRRRAEATLEEGARLLGLDRSGHPVDEVRITPEQQLQVLKDLTAALESKDPYTHGHSQRVERHSYRTAAAMHLSIHDIEDLRKAAALHDVGKIRVPDRILRKPGGLTIEERVMMEEHAVVGAWMVSSVGNADVIAAVRHHHERWDGAGYPDGLAGSDTPLFARVIAVADAYDAITSTRPYRSSSGRDDAVDALRDGSGAQFDPEVVEAFIAALPARLPVTAGLFLLLGGAPQRMLRALASWLKRLGAGSLSPAVGAAGAAVVLGASVFTPNIPPPVEQKSIAAQSAQTDFQPDVDPLPREKDRNAKPARKRSANNKDDAAARRKGDGTVVLSDTLDAGSGDSAKPARQPREEPKRRQPVERETTSNPNDGRDGCPNDGDAGHGNDDGNCGSGDSNKKDVGSDDLVNGLLEDRPADKGGKKR